MDKVIKKSELTFLEKIILLALDDKGWFGTAEHRVKFGLAGAILFELYRLGRIDLKDKEIKVINPKPTEDAVLDKVLNLIKSSKKTRGVRVWIQRIVYKKLLLRKSLLKQLIQKKILRKEEYSLLMVFYQTKYPLVNFEMKHKLQEDINDTILSSRPLTDHELMILVVMNNCKMIRKNLGGFIHYLKVRNRINEITRLVDPKTDTERIIKLLQTSISRAVVASNVSIHA